MSGSRRQVKIGLTGVGQVGRQVLDQGVDDFGFLWISDSKHFFFKRDHLRLSRKDTERILEWKRMNAPQTPLDREDPSIEGVNFIRYDVDDRVEKIIGELIREPRSDWIIIDTSFASAEAGHRVCRAAMGCLAICAANKTPWQNYELSRELYQDSLKKHTFLCLNCTTGVWLDQMEYIPILCSDLTGGSATVAKRDNPSLNFFFQKVWQGIPSLEAFAQIAKDGYLEPKAIDLFPEVKDQLVKARVAANLCSILRNTKPPIIDNNDDRVPLRELFSGEVRSASADDLARWHIAGRREGRYPALVSEVQLDAEAKEISCGWEFKNLAADDLLAGDFPGKNAMSIKATNAEFKWKSGPTCQRGHARTGFVHSGFGGATRTAQKLLWEARDVVSLAASDPSKFHPIPILCGLAIADPQARRVERELACQL